MVHRDENWGSKNIDLSEHVILRTVGVAPMLADVPPKCFPVYFEFMNPSDGERAEIPALSDLHTMAAFVAGLYNYAKLIKCSEQFQAEVDQALAKIKEMFPHA